MTRLVLIVTLLVVAVSDATGEPPAGFAEFAWGTSPGVLRDQLLAKRCRAISESPRAWYSLLCHDYRVEGLAVPSVRLDFEPADSLAGYSMTIARGSYPRFRDLAVQRFGPPTSRRSALWQGSVMSWTSDTVRATLTENCGADVSCMEVATPRLDRKREQLMERERRDAIQSF